MKSLAECLGAKDPSPAVDVQCADCAAIIPCPAWIWDIKVNLDLPADQIIGCEDC